MRFTRLLIALAALVALTSCDRSLKRPPGYIKLGKVEELTRPESNLSDLRLYLRLDDRGFSVMSTECTYDLTPLQLKTDPASGKEVWVSDTTASRYDKSGKVIAGPSTVDLPFYELVASSGVYDGPIDTLYARVGYEKPAEWRLPVKRR
jgi:hypothetical protein